MHVEIYMGKKIIVELNTEFYSDDKVDDLQSYLDANQKLLDVVTFYKNKITSYYQNKSWDKYKKLTNEYELIFTSPNASNNISKYSPVSRSFFKLWEILHDYKTVIFGNHMMPINALFIAEGPGGFAEALMKYRNDFCQDKTISDAFWGITLKSANNKNIPDWKYKNSKLTISYGKDGTGNIYNVENIDHVASTLGEASMDFITADGGFDFSADFNNQEEMSMRLIVCEIYCALRMQAEGGVFIVKVFDMFCPLSIKLVQVLCDCYEHVTMIKPLTSRPANSEKYILCRNFKGVSDENASYLRDLVAMKWTDTMPSSLVDLSSMSKSKYDIIRNLVMFNTFYISRQVMYIQRTIEYIQKFSNANQYESNSIKRVIDSHVEKVKKWCNHYHIPV